MHDARLRAGRRQRTRVRVAHGRRARLQRRVGHHLRRQPAPAVCQHDARRVDQVRKVHRNPPADAVIHPARHQRTRPRRDVRIHEDARACRQTGARLRAAGATVCRAGGAVSVARGALQRRRAHDTAIEKAQADSKPCLARCAANCLRNVLRWW